MKESLICIVCPMGCHLEIDVADHYRVTGNQCKRGIEYGKKELTNPTRTITSTIKISDGIHHRLPVKTDREVPKELIFDIMAVLDQVTVKSPVQMGQIIIENVCNSGANIVASRSM
jgi:CxxC motif-containing protein